MNKEYYKSINNAINYLNNAKQDIVNRKKLIIGSNMKNLKFELLP